MKIYIKNIDGITLPKKGTNDSAGYDMVATSDPKIVGEKNGENWKRIDYIEYETNLYIAPEFNSIHTLIYPRSSISKYNLVLANSIGLVDTDYRGMIVCRFKYIWQPDDCFLLKEKVGNTEQTSDTTWTMEYANVLRWLPNMEKIYKKGDKIAQLVFEPTINVEFEIVNELSNTQRGTGGFGSTDNKPVIPEAVSSALTDLYSKNPVEVNTTKKYIDLIKERERNI